MKNNDLILESIRERDIDLLLIEELNVNRDFCSFFVQNLFEDSSNIIEAKALHSVVNPQFGETDILFFYKTDKSSNAILIENKIDANAQPEQAERYKIRATAIQKEYHCDTRTCIVAPHNYLINNSEAQKYQNQISYETIREYFKKQNSIRLDYKAQILDLAVSQERRGYTPIKDDATTSFWVQYWDLLTQYIPSAEMKRPTIVPANSDWPLIKFSWFPKGCFIYHKLSKGYIDFQTNCSSDFLENILEQNSALSFKLVKTGKSFTLRAIVPPLDKHSSFDSQKENVVKAFNIIKELEYNIF